MSLVQVKLRRKSIRGCLPARGRISSRSDEFQNKTHETPQTRVNHEKVELSSGNVFADLSLRNAEERLLKTKFATKIVQLIETKGWTAGRRSNVSHGMVFYAGKQNSVIAIEATTETKK